MTHFSIILRFMEIAFSSAWRETGQICILLQATMMSQKRLSCISRLDCGLKLFFAQIEFNSKCTSRPAVLANLIEPERLCVHFCNVHCRFSMPQLTD
jgi:hypothetical protein